MTEEQINLTLQNLGSTIANLHIALAMREAELQILSKAEADVPEATPSETKEGEDG